MATNNTTPLESFREVERMGQVSDSVLKAQRKIMIQGGRLLPADREAIARIIDELERRRRRDGETA